MAQPTADVDNGGDGGGGEGEVEVLPRDTAAAGAAEGDEEEVDIEGHGHPLVRRGGPWKLRRRLEQAREALCEAVREVMAVAVHALLRLEGDLHGRRIGANGRRRGISDGKVKGG